VAVTPDGKLVAAPVGFAIHVWDAATGKQVRQIKEFLSQVAVTADGKMLVGKINTVGGSDIKFIDLATGRTTRTVKMAHKSFGHFAMSPDGKWIAVGGGEAGAGSVQVLSVAN
jgi:WD40 repeat protein